MAEPSASRTSGRTRALAGSLGLGLIAASYVVWTSPVVREQINVPGTRTVEQVEQVRADIAAAPDVLPTAAPDGAASSASTAPVPATRPRSAPVIDKDAQLIALVKQVTELTAALKAGNKAQPLQLGTELARYLKTERGIQTMTDAGLDHGGRPPPGRGHRAGGGPRAAALLGLPLPAGRPGRIRRRPGRSERARRRPGREQRRRDGVRGPVGRPRQAGVGPGGRRPAAVAGDPGSGRDQGPGQDLLRGLHRAVARHHERDRPDYRERREGAELADLLRRLGHARSGPTTS